MGESVVACLKPLARRLEVDPLTGALELAPGEVGLSSADEAALETALAIGQAWGLTVRAVVASTRSAGAAILRRAFAAGAEEVALAEVPPGASSAAVAAALAPACADASVVCCGDASLDRGSGSVPAFLAAELGRAQGLGLVEVQVVDGEGRRRLLGGVRRLERGRRERVLLCTPCVVSVEARAASLRRAALSRLLAADRLEVASLPGPAPDRPGPGEPEAVRAFRPRARVVAPPGPADDPRRRILALAGLERPTRPSRRVVHASPEEGARLLLEALRGWGEWPP